MARERGERVDVRSVDDRPVEFMWRGRLYIVTEVQSGWVESSRWWHSMATTGIPADTEEHEMWRVVATTGRRGHLEVFELAYGRESEQWFVTRPDE
ncbi:MAG TPA: DUF6504 family protein [Actinomycetes bacterium]